MNRLPPKRALQFLRWFCREDFIEEIEGDLIELFERQFERSPARANRMFVLNVIRSFKPEFIKVLRIRTTINPIDMIWHNLLITYRNFLRYKGSFLINLFGLSTGLAAAFLIYLWVHDEISVDRFHQNGDRLFQVLRNIPDASNKLETHESNSVLLPPALETEIPEIEYAVPVRWTPEDIVSVEGKHVKAKGWFVGKDFFNAFSYDLVEGTRSRVLQNKYAIVLSKQLALKLFGSLGNCLGKSIEWNGDSYIVSGIFERNHQRSSADFDFLVTHEMFLENSRMDATWSSAPIAVYVTLKPGVDPRRLSDKLDSFYKSKRGPDAANQTMFLQQFGDRYLYGHFENGRQAGGRIDYVILFSAISVFILAIASINFMNLSTARASRRLKEVGIKKVIGVSQRAFVLQHLGESITMVVLAGIAAAGVVVLFLPQFNLITGKELTLYPEPVLILGVLIIVFITGLISGSYPAFYLSRFRPVEILKGKLIATWGELWIRRGLVVFQFSISLLLVIGVTIVYQQMDFVQSRNLGYEKEQVVALEKQGKLKESMEVFLADAKKISGIINASAVSESVTSINSTSSGHDWEGRNEAAPEVEFSGVNVGYDFFETLDIRMKEGRTFSRDFGNEDGTVILNESAVEAMGMTDPVGKWMELFNTRREIVGVVSDFHFQSMYEKINPLFILCMPKYTNTTILRIEPDDTQRTIADLEKLYMKHNPGFPFEYKFLDDMYHALYGSEERISQLSKYFALIAILISCLGVFGLAAFTAERRTKEIGIRKILGCSEFMIVRLLSVDFTLIVLVAIGIALPIGYFLSHWWLDSFAYHIDLKWWYFSGAALAALVITWITVGVQTVKAARINPVVSLRME